MVKAHAGLDLYSQATVLGTYRGHRMEQVEVVISHTFTHMMGSASAFLFVAKINIHPFPILIFVVCF